MGKVYLGNTLIEKAYLGNTLLTKFYLGNTQIDLTPPDTTAPTIGTLTSVVRTNRTTATLTWTAGSDNVGVTGYKIYRSASSSDSSFTLLKSVGVTLSTTDTTIVNFDDTYYYFITAIDDANNESSASNHVDVAQQTSGDIWPYGNPLSYGNDGSSTTIFTSGRYTTVSADSTDKVEGTYSAKFESSGTGVQQYRDSFIPVTAGKDYTIRFWAKSSESGKCKVASTGGLVFSVDVNNTSWAEYEVVVTAGSTSDARIYWWTLIPGATGNGTETLWVDGFRLYEDGYVPLSIETIEVSSIGTTVNTSACSYTTNTTMYVSSSDYPLTTSSIIYTDNMLTTPYDGGGWWRKVDTNSVKTEDNGVIGGIHIC